MCSNLCCSNLNNFTTTSSCETPISPYTFNLLTQQSITMGGIAFSLKDTRGLHTPRMPRTVYRFIRDICHAALRQRFMAVASPIEAPAKQDYGDVDIFVAWDVIGTPLGNYEDISSLLGTTYTRAEELVMCEAQFAVPVSLPTRLPQ